MEALITVSVLAVAGCLFLCILPFCGRRPRESRAGHYSPYHASLDVYGPHRRSNAPDRGHAYYGAPSRQPSILIRCNPIRNSTAAPLGMGMGGAQHHEFRGSPSRGPPPYPSHEADTVENQLRSIYSLDELPSIPPPVYRLDDV